MLHTHIIYFFVYFQVPSVKGRPLTIHHEESCESTGRTAIQSASSPGKRSYLIQRKLLKLNPFTNKVEHVALKDIKDKNGHKANGTVPGRKKSTNDLNSNFRPENAGAAMSDEGSGESSGSAPFSLDSPVITEISPPVSSQNDLPESSVGVNTTQQLPPSRGNHETVTYKLVTLEGQGQLQPCITYKPMTLEASEDFTYHDYSPESEPRSPLLQS